MPVPVPVKEGSVCHGKKAVYHSQTHSVGYGYGGFSYATEGYMQQQMIDHHQLPLHPAYPGQSIGLAQCVSANHRHHQHRHSTPSSVSHSYPNQVLQPHPTANVYQFQDIPNNNISAQDAMIAPKAPRIETRNRQQIFTHDSWPPSPGGLPPTPSFPLNNLNTGAATLPYWASPDHKWPPSPGGLPPPPAFMFNNNALSSFVQQQRERDDAMMQVENAIMSPAWTEDTEADQGPLRPEYAPAAWNQKPRKSHSHSNSHDWRAGDLRARAANTIGNTIGQAGAPREDGSMAKGDSKPPGLVPSPETIQRITNEWARLNSAVWMSDWTSEVLWGLCFGFPTTVSKESLSSSPPSLRRTNSTGSNSTSSSQGTLQQAPPSFKRFVHQTIHQVSASPACVVLGLWYISKLPLLGDVVNENERMFVEELLGSGTGGEVPWRLFVLGMTLSNKWLEDNTFTTKTWHEVTALPIASMRTLEMMALALFSYDLTTPPSEWLTWLYQLRSHTQDTHPGIAGNGGAKKAIGAERDTHGNGRRVMECLEGLVADAEHELGLMSPGGKEPMELGSPILAPVPLTNPTYTVTTKSTKRLPTPAEWDPKSTALDSPQPPSRPRQMYEAVQRPTVIPAPPPAPAPHQHAVQQLLEYEFEYASSGLQHPSVEYNYTYALPAPRQQQQQYGLLPVSNYVSPPPYETVGGGSIWYNAWPELGFTERVASFAVEGCAGTTLRSF